MQFRGFPARSYSPTYPLEGDGDDRLLHFHIRRYSEGLVSSTLGRKIRVGHQVNLTGPFGDTYLTKKSFRRPCACRQRHRLCADIVVDRSCRDPGRPQRELIFVVSARKLQSLYMHTALCRLAVFPNVTIIPTVSEPQHISPAIRVGRSIDYMPSLSQTDVVYTSGAPPMTETVARIAKAAGAKCYTDPFLSSARSAEPNRLVERLTGWLQY